MAGEGRSIALPKHKLEIGESIINGIDGIAFLIPNFHHAGNRLGENMNNDPFGADRMSSPFDFCFNNIAFLKFHIINIISTLEDFMCNRRILDAASLASLAAMPFGYLIIRGLPRLNFLGYEVAPQEVFYPLKKKRDDNARKAYRDYRNDQPFDGIFLMDIIRGGIEENDPRLR